MRIVSFFEFQEGFLRGSNDGGSRTFSRSTLATCCTTETSSAFAAALDFASSSTEV